MIDYEKLKLAHELTKKLPFFSYSFDCWCCTGTESGYFYVLSFDDHEGLFHKYESENIDDLIEKLQDFIQVKPKAEICIECGLRQGTNGIETWQLVSRNADIFCRHKFIKAILF